MTEVSRPQAAQRELQLIRGTYSHQIADKVTVAATAMDAIFGQASGS
jgi:hypothetical protein